MRSIILVCAILLSLSTSCKDNSKNDQTGESVQKENKIDPKDELGSSPQDQPIEQTEAEAEPEKETTAINGQYIKSDHPEDTNCNCYCLDVQLNSVAELCLKDQELYIDGRFEQDGNNINLYYSGKSSRTQNSEIPWDKFEKNTPIAVLSPTANGMKLDWKGFSINGEIAVDYALYGKKTLEGNYKKK